MKRKEINDLLLYEATRKARKLVQKQSGKKKCDRNKTAPSTHTKIICYKNGV